LAKAGFWVKLKSIKLHCVVGECLARNLSFYFGSVIFFIGLLLAATGASRLIVGALDLMTFIELISGVVLVMIGSRDIRSAQRDDSSAKSSSNK